MPDGIYPKYVVFKHPDFIPDNYYAVGWQTSEPGESMRHERLEHVEDFCFVLKISDPHARPALAAYAQSVRNERPRLSTELMELLGDL